MGNDQSMNVLSVGTFKQNFGSRKILPLPKITCLLNISSLNKCKLQVPFMEDKVYVMDKPSNLVGLLNKSPYVTYQSTNANVFVVIDVDSESLKSHSRLGHIGQDEMTCLGKNGILAPLTKVNLLTCEPCLAKKYARKTYGKVKRASAPLDIIHSDICGSLSVKARTDKTYFNTFTDDYTSYNHVYLISNKSNTLRCFEMY